MNRKIKKIFLIPTALALGLASLSLTGCSNNELKVKEFKTYNNNYSVGEEVKLKLELTNKNNYKIESVVINGNSYAIVSDGLSNIYSITSPDLIHNPSENSTTTTFSLTKIIYEKDNKSKELDVKKTAYSYSKVNNNSSVSVKEIKLNSLTQGEGSKSIYQNDEIQALIELEKDKDVTILAFTFEFTDENNNVVEKRIVINDNNTTNLYNVSFDMPNMLGNTSTKITRIEYVKGTKMEDFVLNDAEKETTPFASNYVLVQVLSLLDSSISRKNDFAKDVNDFKYFDSSSEIELNIKLSNPSNVELESIYVCGTRFNLSGTEIEYDKIANKVNIKKTINMRDVSGFPTKLTINKIVYKNVNSSIGMNITLTDDIYYYNKIINNASDFKSLLTSKYVDDNNNINGRFILGKDITLTNEDIVNSFLFNNYNFNGILEGNGHILSLASSTSKPIFNNVGGDIQNLNFNITAHNTNVICNTNNGNITNIVFSGTMIVSDSDLEEEEKSDFKKPITTDLKINNPADNYCLCITNNGTISDVNFIPLLKGSLNYYSLIKYNNGTFKNCVFNPELDHNSNTLLPLPAYNNGKTSSMILVLDNWYGGVTSSDVLSQSMLSFWSYGDKDNYQNIILNQKFRDKADNLNQIIIGPEFNSAMEHFFGFSLYKVIEKINDYSDTRNYIDSLKVDENGKTRFIYEIRYLSNSPEEDKYSDSIINSFVIVTPNESFSNSQYYKQLGLMEYDTSNNHFWYFSGSYATIKWIR